MIVNVFFLNTANEYVLCSRILSISIQFLKKSRFNLMALFIYIYTQEYFLEYIQYTHFYCEHNNCNNSYGEFLYTILSLYTVLSVS